MKNILVFISLFISTFIYSQDLSNLDRKYGFNKFKLESSLQTFQKDLTYRFTDEGIKYYIYNNNDIKVFGMDVIDRIYLSFYQNKLYNIDIRIKKSSLDKNYWSILEKLKELFGKPTNIFANHQNNKEKESNDFIELASQWETDNTSMGLHKIKCNSPLDPCMVNLFLISNKIKNKINNDGF